MKKLKLMTALIAVLLFSDLVFAGNPENLANKIMAKLGKDISLTDSQKVFIQAKLQTFVVTLQNSNSNVDANTKKAYHAYLATLDSILTTEQKTQLITKRNARRDASINKIKSKK